MDNPLNSCEFGQYFPLMDEYYDTIYVILIYVTSSVKWWIKWIVFAGAWIVGVDLKRGMLFVLNKRICNGLHTIDWADGDDGSAATHDQTQWPRIVSYFESVIRIWRKGTVKLVYWRQNDRRGESVGQPRKNSVVLSMTMFSRVSYPFRIPVAR